MNHAFLFMNKKTLYIIIIVACTIAGGFIWNKWKSAEAAKNVSDDLMQQFKAVDESLQRAHDSMERSGSLQNDSIMLEMEKKLDSGKAAN